MMDNTTDILGMIQNFAASNQGNVAKLGNAQKDTEQASAEALAAQQKADQLSQIIEAQKNKAALEVQTETQVFKKLSGGEIQDPNSLIAKLVQDRTANENARMAQAQKIQQMDSVGILDNPIDWLANQLTINSEIDKHNFHDRQSTADSAAITALQNGIQEQNKVALATANTLTQATQAAATEKAAQEAAAKTAELKMRLAGQNMNAIQALMSGQQAAVQNVYTGMRVQMDFRAEARAEAAAARDEARMKMDEERFLMHAQEFNARMDMLQEELKMKKDDIEAQQQWAAGVAKGAAQFGYKPEEFTPQMIKNAERTAEGKAMIDRFFRAGLKASTTVAGTLGDTPGEAMYAIDATQSASHFKDGATAGIYNKLEAIKEAAAQSATGTGPERVRSVISGIDAGVAQAVATSKVNAEARNSLYSAPKLSALVESVPEIKNTLMYATILQPMLDAKVDTLDAGTIKAQIQEAVKRGVLPQSQAMVEGAKIFSSIATFNNVHGKLAEFGIPTQKDYVIPGGLQPGFMAGKPYRFNLADPVQFQKWYLYESLMDLSVVNKHNLFGFGGTHVAK